MAATQPQGFLLLLGIRRHVDLYLICCSLELHLDGLEWRESERLMPWLWNSSSSDVSSLSSTCLRRGDDLIVSALLLARLLLQNLYLLQRSNRRSEQHLSSIDLHQSRSRPEVLPAPVLSGCSPDLQHSCRTASSSPRVSRSAPKHTQKKRGGLS